MQGGTSGRGRIRVRTEHNRDNYQLDDILEQIVKARVKHRSLKAAEKEVKHPARKLVATYEEGKQKFTHHTKSALMAHGKNILLPVRNYYNAQFTDEDGDCYQMMEMSEASHIFDPIFLSKQSTDDIVTVICDLAEN